MFDKDRSNTVFIFYIWRVNWKWYIPLLIVFLAFIGGGVENLGTGPNQEIVVNFYADSIHDQAAEDVVSEIIQTLESLGIEDVRILETTDGSLKILYYSTLDVAVIKKLLDEQNELAHGDVEIPMDNSPLQLPNSKEYGVYNLEVIKIQENFLPGSGFQGLLAEVKSIPNQYFKLSSSSFVVITDTSLEHEAENPDFSVDSEITVLLNKALYKRIPEVRAGPLA